MSRNSYDLTDNAKPELKPCPFCGGESRLNETEGGEYVVDCTGKCGVTMIDDMDWEEEDYDARRNVIEKWNRRHHEKL